jgi:SagB-type dehydrogenase family enzyme
MGRRDLIGLSCGVLLAATAALLRSSRPVVTVKRGVPDGDVGLFAAMRVRRSIREYTGEDVSLDDVQMLCWSAQGMTCPITGYRASPSAGAKFPLEVFAAVSRGVYHYWPEADDLKEHSTRDVRRKLSMASLNQPWVRDAAVDIVLCAEYERTTVRYGERGRRYVHMEAGHAAQNVLLTAVALGLGAVPIGAFDEDGVSMALGIEYPLVPVYLISIGHPAETSCGTEGEQL